jgi:WD40 repeat protein
LLIADMVPQASMSHFDAPTVEPGERAPGPKDAGRYDAFLSYARADAHFAVGQLRRGLEASEQQVWVDVEDILGGAEWRARIKRGIESCNAFIVVISHASVASPHCRQEIEEAIALGKLIIPVVYEDVDVSSLPSVIGDVEWIFLRASDEFDPALERLIDPLHTDLAWRDAHTRLAGRAREWLDSERNKSYLLRGADLRDAERWLSEQGSHRQAPTREQAEYIAGSRKAAGQRAYTLIGALAMGAAVAIGLAILAFVQRHQAIVATRSAQSELLASQVGGTSNSELASLQALESWRLARSADSAAAILHVFSHFHLSALLTGDTDNVSALAYSPDGRRLASGSSDGTVRIWDTRSHRQLMVLHSLGGAAIDSVAYSPDGVTLVTGDDNGLLQFWDSRSYQQFGHPVAVRGNGVGSLAFSPDGRVLAVASAQTVRFVNPTTRRIEGEPLRVPGGDNLKTVAFSPNGRVLATNIGSVLGGAVQLWDVTSRRPLGGPLARGDIESVAFNPNGSTLAVVGGGGAVLLWNVADRHRLPSLNTHTGTYLHSVAFSPNGRLLATGGLQGQIWLWDTSADRQIGSPLIGHSDEVDALAFSPDGRTLASGSFDHTIRMWDIATGLEITAVPNAHPGGVSAVAFSPDGRILASGGEDGTIRLWNVFGLRELGTPLLDSSTYVNDVAFNPDGRLLASAGEDDTVRIWDVASHRQIGPAISQHGQYVTSVAFSPNGQMLASADANQTIRLWNVQTHEQIGAAMTADGAVAGAFIDATEAVKFSPNGRILASGADDGTVRFWSVATHRELGAPVTGGQALNGNDATVNSVAFSPDGRILASGGDDGTLRLWSVSTHAEIGAPLSDQTGGLGSVTFNPVGDTVVTTNGNDTISLWDVKSRSQLGLLTGDAGGVSSVAVDPRFRLIASGSSDGSVRLWAYPSISFYIHQLCDYVNLRHAPALWKQAELLIQYHDPCTSD